MLKIKAKYNEKNEKLNITFEEKNVRLIETLGTIFRLINDIVENSKMTEEEIIELIKDRNNLMERGDN